MLIGIIVVLVALAVAGALFADHLMPRGSGRPSRALPIAPAATALDRAVQPLTAAHPDATGVVLINDGLDAFAARARSARAAGRSLDLMYYLWHDDLTGRLLALEVWRAAERGVRVRMLLDDLNQRGLDRQMLALDAHPNIEVRLYNPFRNRGGVLRLLEMLIRALRVNHRMHNKAWIADGRAAVVGGRNIGEEYFDAASATNFRDLDVLLLGPAVAGAEAVFDRYWNSAAVVPLRALAARKQANARARIEAFEAQAASARAQAYLARVRDAPGVEALLANQLRPVWSTRVEVAADPPAKWRRDDRSRWLVRRLAGVIESATARAALISPYFVAGPDGSRRLIGMAARGVAAGVVTNSLAANDVPAVHSGYARYRKRLLAGGVALHELRARQRHPIAGLFGSSGASLHTKAIVIDQARGFVGSFNLDLRSAALNTEMGVLFDDTELGAALAAEYAHLASPALSYAVGVDAGGRVYWRDATTRPLVVLNHEPGASVGLRVLARLLGWLPIESQL